MRVLLLSLIREHKPILNTTAAFQNIRILGVVIALANNVGRAQLELFRQRRRTRPLDILIVVVCAAVLAPHDVDFVDAASGATDAFQLGECGDAPVRGLQPISEGEGLDFGELDFVGAQSGGGFDEGSCCQEGGKEGVEKPHRVRDKSSRVASEYWCGIQAMFKAMRGDTERTRWFVLEL